MDQLFDQYILPVLDQKKPRSILEIGVLEGKTTFKLLRWAKANAAKVVSLDPVGWEGNIPEALKPPYQNYHLYNDTEKEKVVIRPVWVEKIFEEKLDEYWECHKITSLDYLQKDSCERFEAYVMDGDHNFYTVFHELELIGPRMRINSVTFLHDVGMKWGRTDGYYNLKAIPQEYRHPAEQGVLSAVEHFLRKHNGCKQGDHCVVEDIERLLRKQLQLKNIWQRGKQMAHVFLKNQHHLFDGNYFERVEAMFDVCNKDSLYYRLDKMFTFQIITRKYHGLGLIEKIA